MYTSYPYLTSFSPSSQVRFCNYNSDKNSEIPKSCWDVLWPVKPSSWYHISGFSGFAVFLNAVSSLQKYFKCKKN